jgi:hypothetical protein
VREGSSRESVKKRKPFAGFGPVGGVLWHNRAVTDPRQPGPSFNPVHSPPAGAGGSERRGRPVLVAVLAVLAIVLVAGAAFVILTGGAGAPFGQGPSPTPVANPATPVASPPSPLPTPTQPQPSPQTIAPASPAIESPGLGSPDPRATPQATLAPGQTPAVGRPPPPDIAAQIDEVVGQVPPLRQLEPLREVPYVLLTRAELASELESLVAEEIDRETLATEARVLSRLGLLPEDADLYELLLSLYESQIAAYYRPDTGSFYIIERDQPFAAMDRMIVAHEYTHALQDQHFDLEGSRVSDPSEGDATLAQLAAVEGDASLVMFRWAFENLSLQEQLQLFSGMVPNPTDQALLETMPPILRRQLEFPYAEGFLFASQVEARGGWTAINETLFEPPASTEQIIHPEKYFAGELPVRLSPAHSAADLGDGWRDVYQQTMGELNVQIWLADGEAPPMPGLPAPPTDWQQAAAGWGGDRLHMFENDEGQWAIVWQTAWDSAQDAQEFEAHATPLLDGLSGSAAFFPGREGPLHRTLYVASDESIVRELSNLE